MIISRRRSLITLAVLALAAPLVFVLTASGHGGRGDDVLRTALMASRSNDATLHGVKAGSADWALERGSVRLRERGDDELELRVTIRELVLRGEDDPGSVTRVAASLFCGGSRVGTTGAVRLSDDGNARIRDELDADDLNRCTAPVVLVHPGTQQQVDKDVFIAVSGFNL